MRPTLWTAFWVFLADQATKWLVVHGLDLQTQKYIEVLPPFLNLHMAWNRGVNFGLLSAIDMRWMLVGLAVVSPGATWAHDIASLRAEGNAAYRSGDWALSARSFASAVGPPAGKSAGSSTAPSPSMKSA